MLALGLVVASVLASGCGAAAPEPSRPSAQPVSTAVPSGGTSLRQLGFANGPAGFSIPAEVLVAERVDQPNVVTLVLKAPSSSRIAAYLRANLPAMGFEVVGDKDDSLVFRDATYDGAFTAANDVSGLTLRRVQ